MLIFPSFCFCSFFLMFTAFVVERLIQNRKKNWTFPSILSFHWFFIVVSRRLATFVRVTGECFVVCFFAHFLLHAQTFLHRFASYLLSPYILSVFIWFLFEFLPFHLTSYFIRCYVNYIHSLFLSFFAIHLYSVFIFIYI